MLIGVGITVAEIAYQLGFENPPYFSRLLKKKQVIVLWLIANSWIQVFKVYELSAEQENL